MLSDVEKMCQAGFVRRVAHDEEHFVTATVKATAEESKHRRRFLLWPRLFNDNFEYVPQCKLLSPEDVIAQVLTGDEQRLDWIAVTHDIKSAFFQHAIPEAFQRFCVFKVGDECFVFLVLPMGSTVSPEVQQRISVFLAHLANNRPDHCFVVVHIDNFRFYGPRRSVMAASTAFIETCREYGVTLNDPTWGSSDFLGMYFDYEKRTVRLAQQFVDKVKALDLNRLPMQAEALGT